VHIIDGDTIDVLLDGRSHTVRYIGVDTPERDAPFYTEATAANAELVEGQTVILVRDVSETDRFGRLLRYVYLSDGTFVNAELLRRGYAQAVTFPPDVSHAEEFADLQTEAAAAGLGLWADSALAPQATATQRAGAPAVVTITNIHADGSGDGEPDEWVEIRNDGSQPLQLEGWRLADEAEHTFEFPNLLMQPGQSCRIYTNEHHSDWCGLSYGNAQPIWNNSGDCATVYDAQGVVVARRCY
jgi:endonuclease YncB( thermonuclease family)